MDRNLQASMSNEEQAHAYGLGLNSQQVCQASVPFTGIDEGAVWKGSICHHKCVAQASKDLCELASRRGHSNSLEQEVGEGPSSRAPSPACPKQQSPYVRRASCHTVSEYRVTTLTSSAEKPCCSSSAGSVSPAVQVGKHTLLCAVQMCSLTTLGTAQAGTACKLPNTTGCQQRATAASWGRACCPGEQPCVSTVGCAPFEFPQLTRH